MFTCSATEVTTVFTNDKAENPLFFIWATVLLVFGFFSGMVQRADLSPDLF